MDYVRILFASFCTPLAKSGWCEWQGRSLGKTQGKPFGRFWVGVSLFWDQDAPLAQHKMFPSRFQLDGHHSRVQWCSQYLPGICRHCLGDWLNACTENDVRIVLASSKIRILCRDSKPHGSRDQE